MKSRKERREEARQNKVSFEPQYNGRVITQEVYDAEIKVNKEKQEELSKKINQ